MNILLLKKIMNLGEAGTIVNVKNGYARNYLLPSSLAIVASNSNIKKFSIEPKEKQVLFTDNLEKKLNDTTIIIPVKTKKNNEIYGIINTVKLFKIIKKLKLNLAIENLNNSIFFTKVSNYKIEFKNKKTDTIIYIYIMLIKVNEQ